MRDLEVGAGLLCVCLGECVCVMCVCVSCVCFMCVYVFDVCTYVYPHLLDRLPADTALPDQQPR